MKIFRICVVLVFSVTLGVCAGLYVHRRLTMDYTRPEITLASDTVSIRADGTMSDGLFETAEISKIPALFEGVTAYDRKDGDLTGSIFIEESSGFSEPGVFTVTYAVCDNDGYVARAKRTVTIENYSSPRIELYDDLLFSAKDSIKLSKIIGATDVISGDISSRVIISIPDYTYGDVGDFKVNVNVSNSRGDSVSEVLPMKIEDIPLTAPKIELDEYLIYLEKGKAFDPRQHIISAKDFKGNEISSVSYVSNLDKRTEGLYTVDYYATDDSGSEGHAQLIVIVKGD